VKTYGGKLVENATQAFARDIMAHNMQPAEDAGYAIVLSVHDELLTETPDTDDYSHEALATIMATVPPWAKGIPLAAAGFETPRYRKE
jgi:DNA polymerase bacteriophage-type